MIIAYLWSAEINLHLHVHVLDSWVQIQRGFRDGGNQWEW